jgi:acyl-CoA synthetase (AMP-forming)/AMP-acid ligase II
MLPEIAVFSGDTVRRDREGFLYFIGRRDEMIKTSGYRVSPTEIEEAIYSTRLAGEVAAFGIDHPSLGQAIVVVATPPADDAFDARRLLDECRRILPPYMIPSVIEPHPGPLPRNPNGKVDRKSLAADYAARSKRGAA